MRIGLVKGRRWQWVPNCPISRIVAFVEKVSNLGPYRARWEAAGGTTRGDSCLSNRLYPPPPPAGGSLCGVPKHVATVEKRYLSKKSGTQPESFEPRPKSGQWKRWIERMKGGKLSTSGSLRCRPGQAITIIECLRLSKLVVIRIGLGLNLGNYLNLKGLCLCLYFCLCSNLDKLTLI